MELKNFLEEKNYAHLLGELETNFTITPKIQPWSIMKEISLLKGHIVAGNGISYLSQKEAFLFISLVDYNSQTIITSDGWRGGSKRNAFDSFVNQLCKRQNKTGTPSDYNEVWAIVQELYSGKRN